MGPRSAADKTSKYTIFILGMAFCLGALLFGHQFEYMSLWGDLGVYVNAAKYFRSGGTIPFSWEILALDIDTNATLPAPLGMVNPTGEGLWQFHALPVWPALMAISNLPSEGRSILAILFSINLVLFYYVVYDIIRDERTSVITTTILAALPLMWHQALYATAEMLLMSITLSSYVLLIRFRSHPLFFSSGLFAFGAVHLGIILLAPAVGMVLIIIGITANSLKRRDLARLGLSCAFASVLTYESSARLSLEYTNDIVASMFKERTYLVYVACLFPVLAAIPFVLRDIFKIKMRLARASVLYLYRNFKNIALVIVSVCGLILITQAYLIGWTDYYLPASQDPMNSWSARVAYINKGVLSLRHLSIVNIFCATAGLGLLAFAFAPNLLKLSRLQILLWFIALYFVVIYGIYRVDIPNNYYASRYFLPILVPALLCLAGIWLSRRITFIHYLIVPMLVCASYFNGASIGIGFFQGDRAIRDYLDDNLRNSNNVAVFGSDWLKSHVYPVLLSKDVLNRKPVLAGGRAGEDWVLITDGNPMLVGVTSRCMGIQDRQIPWVIGYPTEPELVQRNICAHRINNAQSSMHNYENNEWTVDGVREFFLFASDTSKEITVEIRSKGWWSSKPPFVGNLANIDPRLEVCGNQFDLVSITENIFVFKGKSSMTICKAIFRTNAFVPLEYGLGSDIRKLGADIYSISLIVQD